MKYNVLSNKEVKIKIDRILESTSIISDHSKERLTNDDLFSIQIKRYNKLKETDEYNESYKKEVLSNLNEQLKKFPIVKEDNLAEIIDLFQKENPSKGSLAHWTGLDNLKKYSELNIEDACNRWNKLLNEDLDLKERINSFVDIKDNDGNKLNVGLDTVAYILGGFNLEKYPVYRLNIYKGFADLYGLKREKSNLGRIYSEYIKIIKMIAIILDELGYVENATIQDGQNCIYCITNYNSLKLESLVEYLYNISIILKEYRGNDEMFIDYINNLDKDYLKEIMDKYKNAKKINGIRENISKYVYGENLLTLEKLEDIKKTESRRYDTNILQSWINFTILFPFYYEEVKDRVSKVQDNIIESIKGMNSLFKKYSSHKVGFEGTRNIGGCGCWIAVYPKEKESHKDSGQLFLGINAEIDFPIRYGLAVGSNIEEARENIFEEVEIENLRYSNITKKFKEINPIILELNNDWFPPNYSPDISKEEWIELINNKNIFREDNFKVMKRMKDNGGMGTCTELAKKYGRTKNFYSRNSSSLGERIYKETNCSVSKRENGRKRWWSILYERKSAGEELEGSYIWKLRTELSDALDEVNLSGISLYENGKSLVIGDVDFELQLDFSSLYFEEETVLKSQIKTALENGKSIILIGPPGTGKSKLAQSITQSYNVDFKMVTAMSDWSSYDTIGGYKPDEKGNLYFEDGIFLSSLKDKEKNNINKWLIIDEINRADIDKAFGPFFSALSGDDIELGLKDANSNNIELKLEKNLQDNSLVASNEYIIPEDWRIIGTMNTFDKTSLYEMSYAFMRRFAFIPVSNPKMIDEMLVKELTGKWDVLLPDKEFENISRLWNTINEYRKVGPALIEDIAKSIKSNKDYTSAVVIYILPQLEGLFDDKLRKFYKDLILLDFIENKERLRTSIEDFFNITLGDE